MGQYKQSDEITQALKTLQENDSILKKYISKDSVELNLMPSKKENNLAFPKLTEVIIGQQLSGSAANKIHSRFLGNFDLKYNFQAENLKTLTQKQIRNCGISNSKAGFILTLRDKIISEEDFLFMVSLEKIVIFFSGKMFFTSS